MINAFRMGTTLPLVVCCRRADYERTGKRLRLDEAVLVHPLGDEQVQDILESGGAALAGLHEAARADPGLRRDGPDTVDVGAMEVAYRGEGTAPIPAEGTPEERRRRVLETYVQCALRERHEVGTRPASTRYGADSGRGAGSPGSRGP